MNQNLLVTLLLATACTASTAQPREAVEDGFSDAAAAYLKKNPQVTKCVDRLAKENNAGRRKQGLEERPTYAEYGEFIGMCA